MAKRYNLIGQRFGRLVVVSREESDNGKYKVWRCKCDCGNETKVKTYVLTSGRTRSCGCLRNEMIGDRGRTHGMTETRIYRIWGHMKNRCYNQNDEKYELYGGRGIVVCDEWLHNFQAFYDWAIKNGYAEDLTIDRLDNNKGYSPNNCRWATNWEQSNNKRTSRILTLNGESHTVAEWGKITRINSRTIENRILNGWSDEKALTTPVKKRKKRK